MKRLAAIRLLILVTISLVASPAVGVVIDDFSVGAISVSGFDPVEQTGLDPNLVLGGARRIDISSYGGGSQVLSIASDQLQFSSAGWGYFDVTYGATQPLGVDLTQGGHDRLLLRFGEVGPGFHPFGVYVSLPTNSSGNGESMYIRDSWDGLLVEIPYSRFPVPFTNVSSITLHAVRNPAGSGFAIESVYTGGPSMAGDYNRDGAVDSTDLAEWQLAAGNSGTSGSSGASFTADDDRDGDVDGSDFLAWQRNLGPSDSQPGLAIPEPDGVLAALVAAFALMTIRR